MTTFVDLVLDSGELVRIECPDKFADDMHEAVTNAMKRRDWWCPSMFDKCHAEFMGMRIDRVNMARVVGMMG